ncbi:hypothetical protein [Pseudomonas rhodesiae]|uniref:hypothetical protein n=1 Tax=Pseudomonas rhodesiae TaxID=76760 RepID=UPI0020A050C2|nr:hypothetical protein [Pseudomonas rhodesiae]MCP1515605.1 hypothetical protein [Pseudomonas rhodesiae]MDF9773009.1 hypothetical protein [Pseudomonas rhodesiae]
MFESQLLLEALSSLSQSQPDCFRSLTAFSLAEREWMKKVDNSTYMGLASSPISPLTIKFDDTATSQLKGSEDLYKVMCVLLEIRAQLMSDKLKAQLRHGLTRQMANWLYNANFQSVHDALRGGRIQFQLRAGPDVADSNSALQTLRILGGNAKRGRKL